MKKTLIAFAALSAIAGVAQAQSTVTLYGLIDTYVGTLKGPTASGANIQTLSQTVVNSGALNGSRWGMRVREDLGNGLAAVANLESGLSSDDGASAQGRLFGRRANVGLTGGFGTFVIGRNTSSYDDVAGDNGINPNVLSGALTNTSAAGLLNRNTTWVGYQSRFNNSLKYTSPNFGGFSGSVMYAFGEDKTTTIDASKSISAYLKFANGPLVVSGGYQSEQPGSTTGVAIANPNTAAAKPALRNTLLSVSYDLGVAKIGAGFNRAKFVDTTASAGLGGGAVDSQKEVNLSVAVPVGAATISAGFSRGTGNTLGKSTGVGVQALYSLSKRTTLYAGVLSTKSYDRVASNAALAFPGSNIGRVQTVATGVRHTF